MVGENRPSNAGEKKKLLRELKRPSFRGEHENGGSDVRHNDNDDDAELIQ